MAKARALARRRKSIQNIRKITRTMELIATARFKKAMDRAAAASAYTKRITRLVADLAASGLEVSHPLLQTRPKTESAILLVLTANRGLCGGYNGNLVRAGFQRLNELKAEVPFVALEMSGKRGLAACRFRNIRPSESFSHFEDKPRYDEVEVLANRYLDLYIAGKLDRLDVVYMKFESAGRQSVAAETLLPLAALDGSSAEAKSGDTLYEFMPSAESILEEVVPTSFKVKLFKCFLDSAVSEQIARMVAMKAATENADSLIKELGRSYNRARQTQITSEMMEVLGGVEALKS
ncbi:MAG: ATP synthase F1 subunit gamma [Pirellulales bacterium]